MPKKTTGETITVTEAANRLGKKPATLMNILRQCALRGVTCPIGFALPPATDRGTWSYIIPKKRFEVYMAGLDFSVPPERLRSVFDDAGR